MAEESQSTKRYGLILVGGLVSLAVGVTGGFTVNRLVERRAALEYELIASAQFTGETQKIAIVALEVSNPSDKEVEDLNCSVDLRDLELREAKVVGLNPDVYSHSVKDGAFRLTVPFLNQQESFSIQLLLSSATTQIRVPEVVVRGKGVTGVPRTGPAKKSQFATILSLLASATGALVSLPALLYLRRRTPSLFFTRKHRDDQRDVVAFVFEMHGFREEAEWARTSERHLSYWAEADRLTAAVLTTDDPDRIRCAMKCLQMLINYALIDDTSELLIHLDIARLATGINDKDAALRHLATARSRRHEVIEKRIKMDERLSALAAHAGEAERLTSE